jgi:glycosyltransferase involved in cell wall biosynthesis
MSEMNNLMVSVEMITYGHEKYIKEAIEGVLVQETDFEFELIIADDCSPDDTKLVVEGIIRNHPNGYKVKYFRHEKNIGMQANASFALQQCKGKYVAVCEGDDYWIDSLKLQRQVDFLQNNPEFGLVHTGFNILHNDTGKIDINRKNIKSNDEVFIALLNGNYVIATLTVCFRKDFYMQYLKEINPDSKNWLMGDLPFWLYVSKLSKIHYLDQITSMYRVLGESASNTSNIERMMKFETNIRDLKLFFLQKYNPENYKLKNQIQSFFLYRKIVINISLNGSFKDFMITLTKFHKFNRNLRLFFGSFLQVFKKVRKSF